MNRNTLWATIFVDELARSGLKAVCAAPGSRHTPLMLAVAKHPDIKVYSHLDERSASFFALGLALASDEPVALICTSGTAGANMYPAIIEAHQSRVPLIVITADRPHELRHSGANQTIDQIKMFGDFVLWFVDLALPEAKPPALAIRNLRTTANRAFAKAGGIRKGVVHINMPFRKPLEPTEVEGDTICATMPQEAYGRSMTRAFTSMAAGYSIPYPTEVATLSAIVNRHTRGIIAIGRSLDFGVLAAAGHIAEKASFPIFADPLSFARFERITKYKNHIVSSYDTILQNQKIASPSLVIQFGNLPTSKSLNDYLNGIGQNSEYIHISQDSEWANDNHSVTHFLSLSEVQTAVEISQNIQPKEAHWLHTFQSMESITWQTIDHEIETGEYFDGAAVYDMVALIPDESTLFAGNSLPVRHLGQFGKPQNKRIYTYANRGASGIDGNISTALGAGAARPHKPLVAILGDITFYHDMNGLLAVHRCGVPVTIVLLNNGGGGIFNRLPIRDYEPEFTEYFLTSHGLDFSHAAKMYGLDFISIDVYNEGARQQFRQAFSDRAGSGQSTIIEVRTDSRKDEARRQVIIVAVQERLKVLRHALNEFKEG